MFAGNLLQYIRKDVKGRAFYILSVAIAALLIYYADKFPVFHNTINFSATEDVRPIGEILKGNKKVEQYFLASQDNLCGIEIQFATYARKNESTIIVQIFESERLIGSKVIRAGELVDKQFEKVAIKTVNESKDKKFRFEVFSENAVQGNAISIWKNNISDNGVLNVNDKAVAGNLNYKLVYYDNMSLVRFICICLFLLAIPCFDIIRSGKKFNWITQNEVIALCVSIGLTLIVRLMWFSSIAYNVDDYGRFLLAPNIYAALTEGRGAIGVLYYIIYSISGANALTAQNLYGFLGMFLTCVGALFIAKMWKITHNVCATTAVIICIVLHPYTNELVLFKNVIAYWIFFPFAIIPFYYVNFNKRIFGLCLVSFFIGLNAYQSFVNAVATALIFRVILEALREYSLSEAKFSWKNVIKASKLIESILLFSVGIIIYLIAFKFLIFILSIAPSDRIMLSSDFNKKILEVIYYLKHFYSINISEPFTPELLRYFCVILIGGAVFGIVTAITRSIDKIQTIDVVNIIAIVGLFFSAAIIAPLGILLIVDYLVNLHRLYMFIGVFWAGLIAVLLQTYTRSTYVSRFLWVIVSVVIIGFLFSSSLIMSDHVTKSMRDHNKALRIVQSLEEQPNFSKVKKIAIIGGTTGYPQDVKTRYWDVSMSAFIAPWANVPILNFISGYDFHSRALSDDENRKYKEILSIWPQINSILIEGDTAIIRLN